MNEELKMSVSPICAQNGRKYAFVAFTDGIRTAEGKIPDCVVIRNEGFTEQEVLQLEAYMKKELTHLKKMAAGINVMDNFLK